MDINTDPFIQKDVEEILLGLNGETAGVIAESIVDFFKNYIEENYTKK